MADWTKPDNTSNYQTEVLQGLRERDEHAAKMDYAGDTNLPVGVIRWNAANARFEEWSGTAWNELAAEYLINVQKLGGNDSTFYRNAANLNAGILPGGRFDDSTHGSRGGGTLHAAATTSADGFMSTADKVELASLRTDLTAVQNVIERKFKPIDQNVNNSVIPIIDDDLNNWSLAAASKYRLRGVLRVFTDVNGGFRGEFAFTNTVDMDTAVVLYSDPANVTKDGGIFGAGPYLLDLLNGSSSIVIDLYIRTDAVQSTVMSLEWAQNASSGNTTLREGSYLELIEL